MLTTAGIQLSQNHTVNVTLPVVKYEPIAKSQQQRQLQQCQTPQQGQLNHNSYNT
jgi:hypothetical protein